MLAVTKIKTEVKEKKWKEKYTKKEVKLSQDFFLFYCLWNFKKRKSKKKSVLRKRRKKKSKEVHTMRQRVRKNIKKSWVRKMKIKRYRVLVNNSWIMFRGLWKRNRRECTQKKSRKEILTMIWWISGIHTFIMDIIHKKKSLLN